MTKYLYCVEQLRKNKVKCTCGWNVSADDKTSRHGHVHDTTCDLEQKWQDYADEYEDLMYEARLKGERK